MAKCSMTCSRTRGDDGLIADACRLTPIELKSGAQQAKRFRRAGVRGQVLEMPDYCGRYAGALGPLISGHEVEQSVRDGFDAGQSGICHRGGTWL
jgi:hypothetical protein